jgi:hypothetical protein
MMQALETKHLLVYMRDPAVAAALNELGWDGRLPIFPANDFLLIVDTNMGYSKVNSLIDKQLNYNVQIQNDDTANAHLTIHYQHQGRPMNESCQQGTAYKPENVTSYQTLVNTCYWNYVRVYTPPGSQLFDSSRHVVPGEMLARSQTWDSSAQTTNDLAGLTTFANFFLLTQGEETSSYFNYQLPPSVIQTTDGQKQYRLDLHQQAGINSTPIQVQLTLPESADITAVQPEPTVINGSSVYFEFELVEDTVIAIDFK